MLPSYLFAYRKGIVPGGITEFRSAGRPILFCVTLNLTEDYSEQVSYGRPQFTSFTESYTYFAHFCVRFCE